MYKTATELFNRLKLEKKQLILCYILDEFGRVGYEATSVRKIASKADLSVGSLYQYFNNKEGMLTVAIEHVFVILDEYVSTINDAPLKLKDRLEIMFEMILKLGKQHPELIIFYNKIPSDKKMITEWVKQFYNNRSFFDVYWSTVKELQN
ncbi:TetR/AcrR family transcriptional regulator [Enterococcus faecalis]|nr:TetR/AcrR family transcriptional regulator [Enterococcus faecalis]